MKKLILMAICMMAVMTGCKKGQTVAEAKAAGTAEAAQDNAKSEDNTPQPMFLIGGDGKYMHMPYWTSVEEPKREEGDEDYFDDYHKRWERQQTFRTHAAEYTNLVSGNKVVKVKYVDEMLKDPDGNDLGYGQLHGRDDIPSLCARFELVNPKDRSADDPTWGLVIVTDSYLSTHKSLEVKSFIGNTYNFPSLPADIVKKMEQAYGMKAEKSCKIELIGNRYIHGTIEFKGEYKNAPKDPNDSDHHSALALELIIDGDSIYRLEELGAYDESWGTAWNADADGYIPNTIEAAFEGPQGLELCYTHGAPESYCVGLMSLRDGQLIEQEYEMFQTLIDEEAPVWKKDFAEMDKLYYADELGEKDVKLTQWAHCYIDYDNEWIWLRDSEGKNGAIFTRKDGKITLIAVETPNRRPCEGEANGVHYLMLEGSAGGSSWTREIHAFKDGKRIWLFAAILMEGELYECSLNDKNITTEEGKAYLNPVSEWSQINAYFTDINR